MIDRIEDAKTKQDIVRVIIEALPEYFGIEEANQAYINDAPNYTMWAYKTDNQISGFISLSYHHAKTAEIHLIAVCPDLHNKGIGKALVTKAMDECIRQKMRYLIVKTLDATHPDPHYAITRQFYQRMGFEPLMTLPTLWDKANPCVIMIHRLSP